MGVEEPEVVTVAVHDQNSNSLLTNSRCCFCFPCFSSRRSSAVGLAWWERIGSSRGHATSEESNPRWWSKGIRVFKKIREWSEIVAGPKWKTFIRRFRSRHNKGHGGNNRHQCKFQYDPLSYALNFDEGHSGNFDDDYNDDYSGFRDFSSRYASVSASGKPLAMDFSSPDNDVAVIA